MPRKVFVAGEILTAADVNTNLMDQAVMVFDDATARTTAIPTPVEGMVTYLKDTNLVQAFTGSAFTPVGGILQVVSTAKTDTFTTASATFVDVTGLTATITPSASGSKVLVMAQISYAEDNFAAYGSFRLSGGNTGNFVGDASSNRIRAVFGGSSQPNQVSQLQSGVITFLDSPSTTSATTYGVSVAISSGSVLINRSRDDNIPAARVRGASSITLMEVAG